MLPSDMDLHTGTLNGCNNLIQIATDDMELGYNAEVNDKPSHPLTTTTTENDFDFPQIDFEDSTSNFLSHDETELMQTTELSHDEKKLSIILGAAVIGSAIAFFRI